MFNPALDSRKPGSSFFLGTYTTPDQNGRAQGIYLCDWDAGTGRLGEPRLVVETDNPSYICLHPSRKFLFSVNENAEGAVSAFRILNTGLELIATRPTMGIWPCHLSLDESGRWLFAANYGSGSVAVFPVASDGTVDEAVSNASHEGHGPHKTRQEAAHAHMIFQVPGTNRVYVSDLGIDRLVAYNFDSQNGSLLVANENQNLKLAPGAGPRHAILHPSGRFLYVTSELDGTISVFETGPAARGGTVKTAVADVGGPEVSFAVEPIQTIHSRPAEANGEAMCGAIRIHPNGRYLYVSHRAAINDLAVFSIDALSGRLAFVARSPTMGQSPRDFVIDASGRFLLAANQHSDKICVFPIEQKTGKLEKARQIIAAPTVVNLLQF